MQCMAVLGWSPPVFWAATPIEMNAALRGRTAMEGGEVKQPPVGRAEFEEMKEKFGG